MGDFRHLQGPGSDHRGSILELSGGLAFDHEGIANAHLAYMSWGTVLATALLRAPKVSTAGARPDAPGTRT